MNKINEILKKESEKISLSEKEIKNLGRLTSDICKRISEKIKNKKIKAEVFVGGSLAKETLVKKSAQDIDLFVRFDKRYGELEISELLGEIVKGRGVRRIHGSRDYFVIKKGKISFEIIPVIKIKNPKHSRNITDLSYFHVKYVRDKIRKNKKLAEEIRLAKHFCHSQQCYGAEGYIHGFSGYALELLVINYGGFLKFIKGCVKNKEGEKIVIDPAKFYRNKQDILWQLNESKLTSPIIFIDPTFKERNALAALSKETFERFKKTCKEFLSSPSESFFQKKEIREKKFNLVIKARTNRQEGDIAGSKLKKFYEFFSREIERYFLVKEREFKYDEKKSAIFYFSLKKKEKLIIYGPPITKVHNLLKFKKKHPRARVRNRVAVAVERNLVTSSKFLSQFSKKRKKEIKAMGIVELKKD